VVHNPCQLLNIVSAIVLHWLFTYTLVLLAVFLAKEDKVLQTDWHKIKSVKLDSFACSVMAAVTVATVR